MGARGRGSQQHEHQEKCEFVLLGQSRDVNPQSAWREIHKVKIIVINSHLLPGFKLTRDNMSKRDYKQRKNIFLVAHPVPLILAVFARGEKNNTTDLFKFKLLLAVDTLSPLKYCLSGM